jgi:tripartite-type tricarboxylate transporter receptor subunit TctC
VIRMRRRCVLAFLLAVMVWPVQTRAAEWPTKPIRIVVPFAPGGAADVWARVIAEHLSIALKQSVVVENRGGAGGVVGSQQVARAEPDGYTLLMGGLASQVVAPAMGANPGYDSLRDFTYVAYIGGPPITWVVHPGSDMRSLRDVIEQARAGKLSGYASSGVGTLGHLVVEYVAKREGLRLNHIPYNTAAFADIIAGRVPLGTFTWGAVLGQARGGTLRPIAITTEERLPDFGDLPTFKELGYDLTASTWFALAAPKGLAPEIAQRLNQEVIKIMELPDVRRRLVQDAFDPKPMTPAQILSFMQAEQARWTPIAQDVARKPQ